MFLTELGSIWARDNATWIDQIFSSWEDISLEVIKDSSDNCAGYQYVFKYATLVTKLALDSHAGSICGNYGGRTKTGAPCKNSGKYAGNRCHAHPIESAIITLFEPGTVVPKITICIGPDNSMRPMPKSMFWQDLPLIIDDVTTRAIDFVGKELQFETAYSVINKFVVWCQDTYDSPLTFTITCHLGTINVSPHWSITRLRNMLQYMGPWTTSNNENVALHGYFVGDYTPGTWV